MAPQLRRATRARTGEIPGLIDIGQNGYRHPSPKKSRAALREARSLVRRMTPARHASVRRRKDRSVLQTGSAPAASVAHRIRPPQLDLGAPICRVIGRIMRVQDDLGRWRISAIFLSASEIVAAACLTLALIAPAQAQFWSPFAPARPPATIQQQQPWQPYNPFGGFFVPQVPKEPRQQRSHGSNELQAPPDNSHAPSPQQRKADVPRTTINAAWRE